MEATIVMAAAGLAERRQETGEVTTWFWDPKRRQVYRTLRDALGVPPT